MKIIVFGHYNRDGYTVLQSRGGKITELYHAGNHTLDSAQTAPAANTREPLRRLRSYCIKTTREMAQEAKATYGGVSREEES